MKVTTKCHNYSGCLRAYHGEEIEIEEGSALVCPECGKPVKIAPRSRVLPMNLMISGGLLLLALVLGLVFGKSLWSKKQSPQPAAVAAAKSTPEPMSTPPPAAQPREEPVRKIEPPMPAPQPPTPAPPEPVAVITSPAKIDLSPKNSENQRVKADVLARIDVMPNITQNNKDKLYASVERARSMGKVLTIPFGSGRTTLVAADIAALKTQVDSPELLRIRDDATAVFVVLGYADPKGDKQKNIEFSQARADAVLAAMRDKCGVVNVMHAVAMGASTLLDEKNLEKNRTVEVWAVLP